MRGGRTRGGRGGRGGRAPRALAAASSGGALLAAAALAAPAAAGEADVVKARADLLGGDRYRFTVTVRHADEGWDHYANAFEVLGPDGEVLGTRVLRHPHVQEQPFTRRLRALEVPEGVARVRVRARDSVHDYGGEEVEIALPGREPEDEGGAPAEDAGGS